MVEPRRPESQRAPERATFVQNVLQEMKGSKVMIRSEWMLRPEQKFVACGGQTLCVMVRHVPMVRTTGFLPYQALGYAVVDSTNMVLIVRIFHSLPSPTPLGCFSQTHSTLSSCLPFPALCMKYHFSAWGSCMFQVGI